MYISYFIYFIFKNASYLSIFFCLFQINPNQSNYNDATINRTCVVFKKLISLHPQNGCIKLTFSLIIIQRIQLSSKKDLSNCTLKV